MARILESPVHAFRVHPIRELGLLIDGADYYRAFYRAALGADRYILLSGWQFDSDVALLRGPEAERAEGPITLLKFLDWLCERKPQLQIYVLAWDFSVVFAAEREWMQRAYFHWMTNERLRFRFDDNHVERGCHHQKFVVIDGELSFLGGLDLCDARWDDRKHRARHPLRINVGGDAGKPFHDIQTYVTGGEFAASLCELFACRWERAGGDPMDVQFTSPGEPAQHRIEDAVRVAASLAALSRTDPHGSPGGPEQCREILLLHIAAIHSAERLIYVETQYFSSNEIQQALESRMRDSARPLLEIVLILNMRGETLKEQAAVGLAQAQVIDRLRKTAAETGHRLGMYYTLPECDDSEEPERATYIHSKLMIVDDRFLSVGSANLTNRSMNVDTELNVSVEADGEDELARSLTDLRANLLAEHTGGEPITTVEGLVAELDGIADRGARGEQRAQCRLRKHPSPTSSERRALALIDPQKLPFDPKEIEDFDEDRQSDFLRGLGQKVRDLFDSRRDKG